MGRSRIWSVLRYLGFGFAGAAVGAGFAVLPTPPGSARPAASSNTVTETERETDDTASSLRGRYEVVAFEAPGCAYCSHFRADIERSYARTERSKLAPVRFVTVNSDEAVRLKLARTITLVPTAVVLENGVEVGRVDGYVGRDGFYRLLDSVIARR